MESLWLFDDYLGPVILLGASLCSLGAWRRQPAAGRSLFWLLAAAGLLALAIDERQGVHEKLAGRLSREGVGTPAGLNHLDDALLLMVALAGLVVCAVFFREIRRTQAFWLPLVGAVGVTAAAMAVDAKAPLEGWAPRIEEVLEFSGQSLLLLAFWRRYRIVAGLPEAPPPKARGAPIEGVAAGE